MIDRSHDLPIRRQAELVNISRGSAYYKARPVSEGDLKLMHRVDELHLELPFAGARMLRDLLRAEGVAVGRKHMTTLMRRMAITALYRKPNTSKKTPGRTIYLYLLRTLPIDRANQVWAMDISYIPMARGFVYLAVVIDWYSRRVTGLAPIDLDGHRVLHGGRRRSHGPIWQSGDLQHRSKQPIHKFGLHRDACGSRHPHLDGRQGLLARQRIHRAAVALDQVRGGIPTCL